MGLEDEDDDDNDDDDDDDEPYCDNDHCYHHVHWCSLTRLILVAWSEDTIPGGWKLRPNQEAGIGIGRVQDISNNLDFTQETYGTSTGRAVKKCMNGMKCLHLRWLKVICYFPLG